MTNYKGKKSEPVMNILPRGGDQVFEVQCRGSLNSGFPQASRPDNHAVCI